MAVRRGERGGLALRTPLVAGNWKMNPAGRDDAVALALATADVADGLDVLTVVCPPAVWLTDVASAVAGRRVSVGAQNVHWEDGGAYTGEISPPMLRGLAQFCIVGHSERRHLFHETDEEVGRKAASVAAYGTRPIVAVGERAEEREAGETAQVIHRQLRAGIEKLAGVGSLGATGLVVAYEPVWAIGTGVAASPTDARTAAALIRAILRETGGPDAEEVQVLYGGSVTPENAPRFFAEPEIDGALVGGASLDPAQFAAIVRAAAAARA